MYESLFLYLLMAYKNKEDQKIFVKKHYENNKKVYKARALKHNKESRIRNRKFINEYLLNHPCVDCGEKDPIVLEFDHVTGVKLQHVSTAVIRSWSISKIEEEIKKCEVRCANCHRRVTHLRRYNVT